MLRDTPRRRTNVPTYFMVFAERRTEGRWEVLHREPDPEHPGRTCPKDIGPGWGREQIDWYIDLSGARGLPADLSEDLAAHIAAEWADGLYEPSWLTVAEIRHLIATDRAPHFSHLNPDWFATDPPLPDKDVRAVFWHD